MTAEEIIEKYSEFREQVCVDPWGSTRDVFTSEEVIENMMIEFANYHVEQALKAASNKAKVVPLSGKGFIEFSQNMVCKDSILNSYSAENIK